MEKYTKFSILLVDDAPENIDILVGILKNYNCLVAPSGEVALKIVNSKIQPDIILLDVMMPGLDGYQVCKKIRQNEKTKDIPIIFLTSKTDEHDIIKGFNAGGQDYIRKPFNSNELLSRVKTHLELIEKRKELKSINLSLEEKVAQRTKQLNLANEKLKQSNIHLEKLNKELQILDDAKSQFLKIISHEIRTPLNGISGLADILSDQLKSSEYYEFIEMLKTSVERLENFSLKALFITEIQTNRSKFSKSSINVLSLTDLVITDLKEKIKNEEISIIKNIPQDFEISGNTKLFKFSIKNIIENSLKFSDRDKGIVISAYNIGNNNIIEITDYGKGFSKESLNNMFRFFSVGQDPVDKNFGLGLATVKLIMDIHFGTITVKNHSEGSTVLLKFPHIG